MFFPSLSSSRSCAIVPSLPRVFGGSIPFARPGVNCAHSGTLALVVFCFAFGANRDTGKAYYSPVNVVGAGSCVSWCSCEDSLFMSLQHEKSDAKDQERGRVAIGSLTIGSLAAQQTRPGRPFFYNFASVLSCIVVSLRHNVERSLVSSNI